MEKYKVDALIEALDRVAGAIFSGAKHLGFNNTLADTRQILFAVLIDQDHEIQT